MKSRRKQDRTAGLLRHCLCGSVFLANLCLAQPANDPLAAARACGNIEDDERRLACLDAVLAIDTDDLTPGARAESSPAEEGHNAPRQSAQASRETGVARAPTTEAQSIEVQSVAVDEQRQTVRIAEIRRNDFGWTNFVTDSGESFVQRSGARGRYPAVPFEAVLEPAMGDSRFLVSPIGGPRVRVIPAD